MTLPILVEQGFRLFCKMYPSDKYAQGIDIDFTDELNDPSVPAVYILSNSKEEILKIGKVLIYITDSIGCTNVLLIQLITE